MNSKRFLALVLVLVLLVAGCGKKKETVESDTEVTTTESTAATQESLPALEDSEFDDETEPAETETQPEPTETETQPEATEETEPAETVAPTQPAKPTAPVEPEETEPTTEPTQPPANVQMDYEAFHNMSPADQQAYMGSFENLDLFFAWYNQAKADYEAANPPIDVGDGNIDMGDLIG